MTLIVGAFLTSPLSKAGNLYVELYSEDDEEQETPTETKTLTDACSFAFRKLKKERYTVKFYEKPTGIQKSKLP